MKGRYSRSLHNEVTRRDLLVRGVTNMPRAIKIMLAQTSAWKAFAMPIFSRNDRSDQNVFQLTTRSKHKQVPGIIAFIALILASALAFYGSILPVQAKSPSIYTSILSNTAAGGYDVVAYFREGNPVEGNAKFTHQWRGATWRFASAGYKDAFIANPEAFAPAYGGHCAWPAAQGYKASGDPLQWRIVNDRLFLNYDAQIKARWETDIPGFITNADRYWPSLAGK
jgi:YHS domain-containing protein